MDFDDAKENIQPLAAGRNASILQASLRIDSPQELLAQRKELEDAIHAYNGDDPLEPWYAYISWIEQSFPSGGKESGLEEVLTKCLARFESEERYYQDRRMVKLYIKFIDSHKNPTECYQQLFNAGIGTMVADFYICWAYYYDLSGNTRKADEIFRRGITCRAQPFEELEEAHQHFGFSVAQRLMYKDGEDAKEDANRQLQERRLALTSLRGHRRKAHVGSIRTGAAVKSLVPGMVRTENAAASCSRFNAHVNVLSDENENPNILQVPHVTTDLETNDTNKSVVRSIIDKAREQENLKEPGPWNKAYNKKKSGKLFGKSKHTNELNFNIHEDENEEKMQSDEIMVKPLKSPIIADELNYDKPFKYPTKFVNKNHTLPEWHTPVTIENEPDLRTYPQYNKCMLYPRPNMEFQIEELCAYYWLQKRGIENNFTNKRQSFWSKHDITANVRQYPNFAKQSKPQVSNVLDNFFAPEEKPHLMVAHNEIYNADLQQEFQIEELLLRRLKLNDTIIKSTDMEETVCMPTEHMQRRKSFFPLRKSIAPRAVSRISSLQVEALSKNQEDNDNKEMCIVQPAMRLETAMPEEQCKTAADYEAASSENKILKTLQETDMSPQVPLEVFEDALQAKANEASKLKTVDCFKTNKAQAQSLEKLFDIYEDSMKTKEVPEMEFALKASALPSTSAAPAKLPFEIFTETSPKADSLKTKEQVLETEFAFKAPALPSTSAAPAKLPFEIFTETSPKAAAGFFDNDETCSTQTFNIFLKTQSASTPKIPQKVAPRQFGVVLKDITPPSMQIEDEQPAHIQRAPDEQTETATAAAGNSIIVSYSPPRVKQLSTILETSEHGSTQGTTHTTGTSTKSAISSPELELESNGNVGTNATPSMARARVSILPQQELEVLQERSIETSTASGSKVTELMNNMHLQSDVLTTINSEKSCNATTKEHNSLQQPTTLKELIPDTPTHIRLQAGSGGNFAIFEDILSTQDVKQQAGNFSRLEEREDTAAGYLVRSVRFQEDKTETISKMLLASRQDIKFPEEKTETISKFLLASAAAKMEDDKPTESIAKLNFQSPINLTSPEDSFKFFANTPPKMAQYKPANFSIEHQLTPLESTAKRLCAKQTPDTHSNSNLHRSQNQNSKLLFKDDLHATSTKSLLKPSDTLQMLFEDFSIVQATQPTHAIDNKTSLKPKTKIPLRDSFIPDFSYIEETQSEPQAQAANTRTNLSFIPDTQAATILKDSSSHDKILPKSNQSKLTDSFLPEISLVMDSQPLETGTKWRTQNKSTNLEDSSQKHMLMESFMKDFAVIKEPPKQQTQEPQKINTTLKFLSDSLTPNTTLSSTKKSQQQNISNTGASSKVPTHSSKTVNASALNEQLACSQTEQKLITPLKASKAALARAEQFFELNAETEMFATNLSMIKNSTFLPSKQLHNQSQIHEKSLHIKTEAISPTRETRYTVFKSPPLPAMAAARKSQIPKLSFLGLTAEPLAEKPQRATTINERSTLNDPDNAATSTHRDDDDDEYNGEMSIYFKHTPKTPKNQHHQWEDEDADHLKNLSDNQYQHQSVDLNLTNQLIDNNCIDPNVNPFNADLINAFLDQIDFTHYISELPTCMLVRKVACLQAHRHFKVHEEDFEISKLVGEGAYGAIYYGIQTKTGKKCAIKQERPPNFWEYYICLEVHSRLKAENMHSAFMSVDYALMGNNASILISTFSQYGSLIAVCNKIKKHTTKNVDEYVVMHLVCELLKIMDHLHASFVIHADIKADNFLLMNTLKYPSTECSLQLIDFGVSIDMKTFKPGQTFNYINNDNAFKCIEMREERRWTYQLDLYGLAGVIHVLLFGKYMDIEKRPSGIWLPKTHMPRYFNKTLWENIFKTLLNIRDCNSMPNLQELRVQLLEALADKEKYTLQKIAEFNRALHA